MDDIIFRFKQKCRNSRAQAEQPRREDNTRFVRGLDNLRRGFSNNVQDRDLLACGEKWGGRHVARQGNSRRIRKHSTRFKDGVAISGLPENCYDSEWLNSLQRYQRDKLDVRPSVDLAFSEEEKQCAPIHRALICLTPTLILQIGSTVHTSCKRRRVPFERREDWY